MENTENKKNPMVMDITYVETSIPCGNGQSVTLVSSKRKGAKHTVILPSYVKLNDKTIVNLCSSKNDYNNLDCLNIVQKDRNDNVVSSRTFVRTEEGNYREDSKNPPISVHTR